jgi:hypothetical protein
MANPRWVLLPVKHVVIPVSHIPMLAQQDFLYSAAAAVSMLGVMLGRQVNPRWAIMGEVRDEEPIQASFLLTIGPVPRMACPSYRMARPDDLTESILQASTPTYAASTSYAYSLQVEPNGLIHPAPELSCFHIRGILQARIERLFVPSANAQLIEDLLEEQRTSQLHPLPSQLDGQDKSYTGPEIVVMDDLMDFLNDIFRTEVPQKEA